jgi:PAS domain S-box-containing protein
MANEQILVVEDEGIVALDIQSMLEDLGYQVPITVGSGEEALASIAENRPNLVLMDINLDGEIDGVETAEQIRDRYNIPVVYLTAYSDDDTLQRAKLTTPFGYLVKPLEARSLKTTIEMAIYRHELEQELKQSKEWFATTLRSIGDAVIATDESRKIAFLNTIAEQLTGWSQNEAIGREVSEVLYLIDEDRGVAIENPGLAFFSGQLSGETIDEAVLVAKQGRHIPIENTVTPITDRNNRTIGVVWVFRDISDRKQAEALEKDRIRLETEVKQRSIAEAEIRRSLELERQLSELKSRLIANVSHEFRTPLSVILSSSELLQTYSDIWSEEKKNSHFQRIKSAIDYMTKLVSDVSVIGQAEAGKLSINPVPLELVQFCRDLVEERQITAGDRYQISFETNRDRLEVTIDDKILEHILLNLLSNALKYSPEGGRIEFKLTLKESESTPEESPHEAIVISIQDPGIGIPPEDLPNLFKSFQRATNVRTIRGTGLGLSIVRKCVDLLEGQIEIKSEIGRGTTVTVTLPRYCKQSS